ncbi:hypothetical protein PISL3812_03186 [Talaromyces islandicus]|uniref:Uncharacterized protein n=1 Tax=Talaromyces islandicus TaxID=28573 RepID=A0A0U1LS07_TALIS|nr:hypothetical protein PISL3812_03186 [Talaromyces islandicus]
MPDSLVAPSPVIPTYRPEQETSTRRLRFFIMPSVAVEEPQSIPSVAGLHRPPPRSAGASSRPMRSENISELVRFFQAPQGNEAAAAETSMNIIRHDGAMDLLKAGQRRLRQLGQTKPDKRIKGTESPVPSDKSSIRSTDKEKAKRQHLQALQREGLIPNADLDSSRPSRTKQDVEAMGRPWLDDSLPANHGRKSNDGSSSHLRSESLGLGDLAALVEFSLSFPELYSEDPNPPPYQARNPNPSAPSEQSPDVNATANSHPQPAISPPTPGNNGTNYHNDRLLGNFPRPNRDAFASGPRAALDQVASVVGPSRPSAARAVDFQPDRGQDDRGCSGDDAKSLAVLLRATERLGREKASASGAPVHVPGADPSTATTTTTTTPTTVTASASSSSDLQPHSLNQGVTDTPLFVKAPEVQVKHGRAEEAAKHKNASKDNSSGKTNAHPPILAFPPQSKPDDLPKNHNAGPIPLKLVAECLPTRGPRGTAISKSTSPQLLLSSSKEKSDSALLKPTHTAPRPQVLLSPFPIQTRRARSLTPDVALGGKERKKKKKKLSPLYVVNAAAPLPPPSRPLPSVPQQSAEVNDQNPLADGKPSTTMTTPAPDMSKGHDAESPTLGSAVHKPKLRRSLIGPRPSSRYSIRSNDQSETYPASDEQSSKAASPGRSSLEALDEVRGGRADKVNALRLRDLGGKKNEKPTSNSENPFSHQSSEVRTPTESTSHGEKSKRDRKHRASAAPFIPLPNDPPVFYDTPKYQNRRGSTSSLPGSTSTINLYGGGLSRSVSVTSGSIAGSSIRHSRARQAVREPSKVARHRRADSPSLPSSDDDGPKPRTRYSQARLDSVVSEHHPQRTCRPDHAKNTGYPGLPLRQYDHHHHEPVSPRTPRSPPRSQPGPPPRQSYVSHSQSIHYLEARVAMLERQNKMLQAALLAALDIGVSHDAESVRSGSPSPALESTRIPTISETSMLSPTGFETPQPRKYTAQTDGPPSSKHWASPHRHASQESHGSFETSSSHSDVSMREVENMLSDVDVGASGEP